MPEVGAETARGSRAAAAGRRRRARSRGATRRRGSAAGRRVRGTTKASSDRPSGWLITWTSIPTPDSRITRPITDPRVIRCQLERRLAPITICVTFSERAASSERLGDVGADDLVVRAAELLDEERAGARAAPPTVRRARPAGSTWTATSSPFVRCAIRAARRTSRSPSGEPVSATRIRSRVSHGSSMPWRARYSGERLVDPVGEPEQGELAQRPRGCRGGSSSRARCRSARAGRRCRGRAGCGAPRGQVDELELVGAAHDLVGDRLALGDAGDLLDDVVERLEVLDVQRRDDVDARREQLLDVLPALLVPRARARSCARARRRARPAGGGRGRRRRPSPRTSRRGTSTWRRGTTSRSPTCSAVFGRPCVSTKPTTTSVAVLGAAAPLVQHRERLADARRGAEVDAERPARHARQRAASAPSRRARG